MANFLDMAKGVLKTVAPTLATSLAGPFGGVAASALLDALLPEEEAAAAKKEPLAAQVEKVYKQVATASPETLTKLRKIDADFKVRMRELDIEEHQLENSEMANARSREIALRDKNVARIAWCVIFVWLVLNVSMVWLVADSSIVLTNIAVAILFRILGTMDGAILSVLHYYYGTTAGSKAKDDAIHTKLKDSK